MARGLLGATAMRLLTAMTCLLVTTPALADVKKVANTDAAQALDSVLEHVVSSETLPRVKAPGSATGTLEITKDGAAKPVIKGRVVAGAHERTIDWDFMKGTGTFESVKRDGSRAALQVVVTAHDPAQRREVVTASDGVMEEHSTVDTHTVKLKSGGTAAVVKSDSKIVVAGKAAATFQATGGAKILTQRGYTRTEDSSGALVYTRNTITIGGQKVSVLELDTFMKSRVSP